MSDIVASLRQVIQDLVAPDLKSHTAKLEALQKQADVQYDSIMNDAGCGSGGDAVGVRGSEWSNQAEVFRQMTAAE